MAEQDIWGLLVLGNNITWVLGGLALIGLRNRLSSLWVAQCVLILLGLALIVRGVMLQIEFINAH